MRRTTAFAIIALVSVTLMVPAMIWAQAEVVQYFDNGSINWSTEKVVVKGIGAPPANPANMAQARAMARRAAITVARRNLLEITQGVRLVSLTLVKDFIVKSDMVRTSVQGVVRNAQVVDTAYMSDGSVEVTMVMSLTGEFGIPVQKSAEQMTRTGLAHVIATDAHFDNDRINALAEAVDLAAEVLQDYNRAEQMVNTTPAAIIAGDDLDLPEPDLGRKKWWVF